MHRSSLSPHPLWPLLLGLLLLLPSLGCRPPHDAERAWTRFQEALERDQHQKAWALLTQKSRKALATALQQSGSKEDPSRFFLTSSIHLRHQMRPDPRRAPTFTPTHAILPLRDSLDHPHLIRLEYEDKQWRIALQGRFTFAPFLSHPPTSQTTTTTTPPPSSRPLR